MQIFKKKQLLGITGIIEENNCNAELAKNDVEIRPMPTLVVTSQTSMPIMVLRSVTKPARVGYNAALMLM